MEGGQISQLSSAPKIQMSALAQPESGSRLVAKLLEFSFTVHRRRGRFIPDKARDQALELWILA
jgi:hypothetical protein